MILRDIEPCFAELQKTASLAYAVSIIADEKKALTIVH